jgi:TATA-box binding protein (TBP) (component of TFIID and TFIIIB)
MESPTLTTMVVLYEMGVRLDTTLLATSLPLSETVIKIEKQGIVKRGESKKDKVKHRTQPVAPRRTTGFGHNSLTMVLLSDGSGALLKKEITVKIFQNGVFHITGVLDERYDREVTQYLEKEITQSCPTAVLEGKWTQEKRRVVLMNYKTRLMNVTNLSREQLHASLRRIGMKTSYEPAVYPAVKIYFPDTRWIAKVFRTGNIILTGMTSAEECVQLTKQLAHALEQTE